MSEEKPYEITFKFFLPEHKTDVWYVVNAQKMFSLLWDIDQECRNKLKYGDDKSWDAFVVGIRDMIRAEIDLDEGNI